MKSKHLIKTKRIYEPTDSGDGFRVLVDRLWPRGISKDRARIDLWLKEVAPSDELRKWYGHDPKKWSEFRLLYRKELINNTGVSKLINMISSRQRLTILYAAKDELRNNAVVLKEVLARKLNGL